MAAKTFFPVQVKIEKTQKSTLKIMYSKKKNILKELKLLDVPVVFFLFFFSFLFYFLSPARVTPPGHTSVLARATQS